VIYTVFSFSSFASLVVVDVILYAATILLELAALVALRVSAPHAARPYRVPGGWLGVWLVVLLPTTVLALAIVATAQSEGMGAVSLSAAGLASGVVLYPVVRFLLKRDAPDVYVPLDGEAREVDWLGERLPSLVPRERPEWR
ncbi:MAG TPA: hypothetical protein VFX49_07460, partial [Chloroflexota bacterium]|nr:hypothetical protein [Chloroflexota bacterium]